ERRRRMPGGATQSSFSGSELPGQTAAARHRSERLLPLPSPSGGSIMPAPKLSRRTVLRGAGTIAIGLPWLEAMKPMPEAHAQDATAGAKRFLAVYQPGGNVMERWHPTGSGTDYTLSSI